MIDVAEGCVVGRNENVVRGGCGGSKESVAGPSASASIADDTSLPRHPQLYATETRMEDEDAALTMGMCLEIGRPRNCHLRFRILVPEMLQAARPLQPGISDPTRLRSQKVRLVSS